MGEVTIMGREVKRVPLDFNWPLHKTWEGFLNKRPGPDNCVACDGSGSSPTAKKLSDQWYGNAPFRPEDNGSVPLRITDSAVRQFATKNAVQCVFTSAFGFDDGIKKFWTYVKDKGLDEYVKEHPLVEYDIHREAYRLIGMWNGQWSHHLNAEDVKALLDDDRLIDFTRNPLNEEQKAEYEAVEEWNKAERERLIAADWKGEKNWKTFNNGHIPTPQEVNEWNILSFGHDSINSWVCVKAKCKRLRVARLCKVCKGNGHIWQSKEAMRYHNAWRSKEPPTGDGYQIWETVSEGSPVSPVFATPEELARWMIVPGKDTTVTKGTTYEQWMGFLKVGWAPSGYSDAEHGYQDGVRAIGDREIEKETAA
jgi:hypothetical protein